MSGAPERVRAFLAGISPVPSVCLQIYLSLYLEPHRRRALVEIYRQLLGDRPSAVFGPEQVMAAEMDAWDRAWSLLRHPPAWMPMRLVRPPQAPVTIRADGERLFCCAEGEAERDLAHPGSPDERDIWDGRELPQFEPDPERLLPVWDATDEQLRCEAELGAQVQARWGHAHLLYGGLGMPFWACYRVLGFAGLMETMHTDPGLLEALIQRATHNALQQVRLIAAAGAQCLFFEECFCSSDLISERDYLRFSYPATETVLQAAREVGLRTVYYFCGGIEGRVEHLARLPADALAFEESKKDFVIDLAHVRAVVGEDRPLLGNLDATLIRDWDEAGIARAVRRQFEEAGPLLATSAGSPLTLDTPLHKLDALVRATEALAEG